MEPEQKQTFKEWWKEQKHELKIGLRNKLSLLLTLLGLGFCVWIFFEALHYHFGFSLYAWIKEVPYVLSTYNYFYNEIANHSELGILYLFAFASLFFLPKFYW